MWHFSKILTVDFWPVCCALVFIISSSSVHSECDVRRGRSYVATKRSDEERPCVFVLEFNQVRLSTSQIVDKYGLKIERHQLTTEDGYDLELHRVPNPGKPVVLLVHGLFQSSRDFFINCDRRALGIKLADENFDVWVTNFRGNAYSMRHANFTNDELEYWDFSVDNLIEDAGSTIDYILGVTGKRKLSWAGYSLGNGVVLGLLASKPQYNAKVDVGFILGGAPVLSHMKSPFIRLLAPFAGLIERMVTRFNHGELLPRYLIPIMHRIFPLLCLPEARSRRNGICALSIFLNDGYNPRSVDPRVLSVMLGQFPGSVSVKSFTQWLQWVISGKFTRYDYGALRNLRMYGQASPPTYNLKKVTAPLIHFWGENDFITTKRDVQTSEKYFPNVQMIKIPSVSFNHVDFLFSGDADIYIYNKILNVLNDRNNLTCQNSII